MFVQIIDMTAPIGKIQDLRRLIATDYLPALEHRPGFISGHLLEQVDDRDHAKLIIYWNSHAALEDTNRTGVLSGSTSSIMARLPGLRVQRQSFVVDVSAQAQVAAV